MRGSYFGLLGNPCITPEYIPRKLEHQEIDSSRQPFLAYAVLTIDSFSKCALTIQGIALGRWETKPLEFKPCLQRTFLRSIATSSEVTDKLILIR